MSQKQTVAEVEAETTAILDIVTGPLVAENVAALREDGADTLQVDWEGGERFTAFRTFLYANGRAYEVKVTALESGEALD